MGRLTAYALVVDLPMPWIETSGGAMPVRILDISEPGHLGSWTSRYLDISVLTWTSRYSVLDISVLGTGQFGTWMRQYSLLTTFVWYLLIVNIFVLVVL
jgi:hypothetical protein